MISGSGTHSHALPLSITKVIGLTLNKTDLDIISQYPSHSKKGEERKKEVLMLVFTNIFARI